MSAWLPFILFWGILACALIYIVCKSFGIGEHAFDCDCDRCVMAEIRVNEKRRAKSARYEARCRRIREIQTEYDRLDPSQRRSV